MPSKTNLVAKQLDTASNQTIATLSQIHTSQLSILVLQQGPFLERFLSSTLRKLVHRVLDCDWISTEHEPFSAVLRLLENASRSADPTLVKRLLGANAVQSVVDFAVLAGNASPSLAQRVEKVMRKLVDAESVGQYLDAGLMAAQNALNQGNMALQRRTSRVLSALLRVLPIPSSRKAPTPIPAAQDLATTIAASHRAIDVSWNGIQASATKLALVDAAAALLGRLVVTAQKEQLASVVLRFVDDEGDQNQPASSTSRRKPLVDAPLLVDLCLAAPPALLDRIEGSLRGAELASTAFRQARDGSKSLTNSFRTDLASLSPAWSELVDEYKQLRLRKSSKGKARAPVQVAEPSASLLAMIDAILPDLAADHQRLRRILSRHKFQQKSDEETIQLLLDDQDTEDEDSDAELAVPLEDPIATSNIYQPSAVVPTRANVFDSQPLDESRLRYGGASKVDTDATTTDMPASLKASILARVQAQDVEEHAAAQEWNPFADEERGASRDVGFEEELEDEEDRVNRRFAVSNLGGERGNAGDWRRRLEDYDDESDGEDEDGEDDDGNATQTSTTAAVSSERNAERILILAYSRHGQQLFNKDVSTRKSAQRKALKAELESTTGKAYDDNLIESWGTMFERNVSSRKSAYEVDISR